MPSSPLTAGDITASGSQGRDEICKVTLARRLTLSSFAQHVTNVTYDVMPGRKFTHCNDILSFICILNHHVTMYELFPAIMICMTVYRCTLYTEVVDDNNITKDINVEKILSFKLSQLLVLFISSKQILKKII